MEAATQFLRSLGPGRLAAMGLVTAALVGFFAFLILRLSTPTMVPLYTELSLDDSRLMISELEDRGVPYQLRRDGSVIMVPDSEATRLRMALAGEGLPSGGGVGYEIFDNADTLGATNFVQNVNRLRALEGELARSIRTINGISAARVHLVIPERQLFSRDSPEPTASISLQARGDVAAGQIRAIQHLVAAAVEGLEPGSISVVDETGRLLADGRGGTEAGSLDALEDRREALEHRLRNEVEDILAAVLGPDRVRVQIAAELDHNRRTRSSEVYDPDSRVVRSTQTREESSSASEAHDDAVSVGDELPDADGAGAEANSQEASSQFEEIVNYEISRTETTEVIEAGQIERLSVAVVVDGSYNQTGDGDVVYEPRGQEELDRIAALVRSAIGYDEARGDTIEVANLRFAEAPQQPVAPATEATGLSRSDIMRLAELAVLGLLGLLAILFIARPLVRQVLSADKDNVPRIEAPEERGSGAEETRQLEAPTPQVSTEAIQLAQVAGEAQADSVKKVAELIDQNPKEAVAIIRNWIHEPAT